MKRTVVHFLDYRLLCDVVCLRPQARAVLLIDENLIVSSGSLSFRTKKGYRKEIVIQKILS